MSPDEAALAAGIDAVEALGPLDPAAMADAAAILDALTKPPGSLGRLEDLVVQLAGITGDLAADLARSRDRRRGGRSRRRPTGRVGLSRRGHDADGRELPGRRRRDQCARGPSSERALTVDRCRRCGADPGRVPPRVGRGARLIRARVRAGHRRHDDRGRRCPARRRSAPSPSAWRRVASLRASGVELVAVGEMGIGNTTAASAITAAMTGLAAGARHRPRHRDRRRDTRAQGRDRRRAHSIGTGPTPRIRSASWRRSAGSRSVRSSGCSSAPSPAAPRSCSTASSRVRRRSSRRPSRPGSRPRLIAGHRSVEPGHAIVLERLGLRPLLELDLRLGEGTGAALAIAVIDAADRPPRRDGDVRFGRRLRPARTRSRAADRSTEIVLVRHAATTWSGSRYCGRSDPPLSDAGRAEAARLAAELAPLDRDRDAADRASPSIRALDDRQRRSPRQRGSTDVEIDDRWLEADVGVAEGRTFDELAEHAPALAAALAGGALEIDWPGGETHRALAERVADAWAELDGSASSGRRRDPCRSVRCTRSRSRNGGHPGATTSWHRRRTCACDSPARGERSATVLPSRA